MISCGYIVSVMDLQTLNDSMSTSAEYVLFSKALGTNCCDICIEKFEATYDCIHLSTNFSTNIFHNFNPRLTLEDYTNLKTIKKDCKIVLTSQQYKDLKKAMSEDSKIKISFLIIECAYNTNISGLRCYTVKAQDLEQLLYSQSSMIVRMMLISKPYESNYVPVRTNTLISDKLNFVSHGNNFKRCYFTLWDYLRCDPNDSCYLKISEEQYNNFKSALDEDPNIKDVIMQPYVYDPVLITKKYNSCATCMLCVIL